MIQHYVSIQEVITLLNEALKLDPEAITALMKAKVPCNEALSEHPTIQCGGNPELTEFTVGPLGILNGLFGSHSQDHWGAIAASYELVCPNGCDLEGHDDELKYHFDCPVCGKAQIELGAITDFVQIRPAEASPVSETDVIIVLEGGLVQEVLTSDHGVNAYIMDYDTEGADEDRLTLIDGKTEAYVHMPWTNVLPDRVTELIKQFDLDGEE